MPLERMLEMAGRTVGQGDVGNADHRPSRRDRSRDQRRLTQPALGGCFQFLIYDEASSCRGGEPPVQSRLDCAALAWLPEPGRVLAYIECLAACGGRRFGGSATGRACIVCGAVPCTHPCGPQCSPCPCRRTSTHVGQRARNARLRITRVRWRSAAASSIPTDRSGAELARTCGWAPTERSASNRWSAAGLGEGVVPAGDISECQPYRQLGRCRTLYADDLADDDARRLRARLDASD